MGWLWKRAGPSGFGYYSSAEQVTEGVHASNLTAIVTGGASAIGEETVRVLALRGAEVVMAVRNVEAGEEVKNKIIKGNSNAKLHVLELDLSSMSSVRKFAESFDSLGLPLNILINNAGVMACPFQLSADGIELQFATNHIGHFLLTSLLLDKMKRTASSSGIPGRIVVVASYGHTILYPGGINFDKINDKDRYSPWKSYGQSKLANILHANELSRRLKDDGVSIVVNSVHPGTINTNLKRHLGILKGIFSIAPGILKTIPQGASTQCMLALNENYKDITGKYFDDCNETKPSDYACDHELAKKLWDFSENLVAGGH